MQAGAGKSIEPIVRNCSSASFLLLLICKMSPTYYINRAFDFNFNRFSFRKGSDRYMDTVFAACVSGLADIRWEDNQHDQ